MEDLKLEDSLNTRLECSGDEYIAIFQKSDEPNRRDDAIEISKSDIPALIDWLKQVEVKSYNCDEVTCPHCKLPVQFTVITHFDADDQFDYVECKSNKPTTNTGQPQKEPTP